MENELHFNLSFIKQRREELKLTHQVMAEKLGYKNGSTYLKYENGTYLFKADILPKLALALDCDIKDFYTNNVAKIETKENLNVKNIIC